MTDYTLKQLLEKIKRDAYKCKCNIAVIKVQLEDHEDRIIVLEGDVITINQTLSDYDQRITDLETAPPPGAAITVVNDYSALPAANTVPNEFYYCMNSQGTAWLPGSLGGTYYKSGIYYSTGSAWITDINPYQASQVDVDAGIITDQFVSPNTLANYSGWASINSPYQRGITVDGSGDVVTTGVKGRIYIPVSGTITEVVLLSDLAGDVEFEIEKSTFAGFPGSLASIVGANAPELVGTRKAQITLDGGWTTTVTAGDVIEFSIVGTPATLTQVSLFITITP